MINQGADQDRRYSEQEKRMVRSTLLIGLGGTGREIITRVRRRLVEEYGDLSNFPIVKSFLVDTDTGTKTYTRGLESIVDDRIRFGTDDVFLASVDNVSTFTQNLHQYPHIAEWLYPNLADIGDLRDGAAAIRPYGRLAFFINYDKIRENLVRALQEIQAPAGKTFVSNEYGIQCAPTSCAYIICSLAGGTGSSMFLDVAFTLKQIASANGIDLARIGFLVMPDLYGGNRRMANGYAALKELEHHTRTNNFDVQYNPLIRSESVPIPPFDFTYLIHGTNEAGTHFGDIEDMFELLAENIYLDFSNDAFAAEKRAVRVNFADVLARSYSAPANAVPYSTDANSALVDEREVWSTRYMSLGYTSISYPANRIIRCCACKLVAGVLNYWGKLDKSYDAIVGDRLSKFVYDPDDANRGFFNDLGIYESMGEVGRHDVLEWVTKPGNDSTLLEQIRQWGQGVQSRVQNDDHMRDELSVTDFLDKEEKTFNSRYAESPVEAERGQYVKMMDNNVSVLLYGGSIPGSDERIVGCLDSETRDDQSIRGNMHNRVADYLSSGTFSFAEMMDILEEVKRRLSVGEDSYRSVLLKQIGQSDTGLQKEQGRCEAAMDGFKAEIDSLLAEREQLLGWPNMLPWDRVRRRDALKLEDDKIFGVLNEYKEAAVGYFHTKSKILARRRALSICDRIAEYSDTLTETLDNLGVTLREFHKDATSAYEASRRKIDGNLLVNIYEAEDIETLYYPMGDRSNDFDYHGANMLSEIGNGVSIVDLPYLKERAAETGIEVFPTMVKYARSVFENAIKGLNILDVCEQLAKTRTFSLQNTYDFGKPWVAIEEALPNLQLNPTDHKSFLVGRHTAVSGAHDRFDILIAGKRDMGKDPVIQFTATLDASKILISTEIAGFPLAASRVIRNMKAIYKSEYRDPGSTLHIHKDDFQYRDIINDEEEQKRIYDVNKWFVLGTVLGVLHPDVSRIAGQVVYSFRKDEHLEKIDKPLGVENRAKVALEGNSNLLSEIRNEVLSKEGKLLKPVNGKYSDGFRNYYLTLFWYFNHVYGTKSVDMGGGMEGRSRSQENLILQAKLDELVEMYKQTYAPDERDEEWDNFLLTAKKLMNSPDEYSEEVPPFEVTKLRNVRM